MKDQIDSCKHVKVFDGCTRYRSPPCYAWICSKCLKDGFDDDEGNVDKELFERLVDRKLKITSKD